jgi:uncharacterized YccA/Bax inhibitor family protein
MADLPRSNNPILKESAFAGQAISGDVMVIQGTVNKTGLLVFFVVVSAACTWGLSPSESSQAALPWMLGGATGGFGVALVAMFKKNWSPQSIWNGMECLV